MSFDFDTIHSRLGTGSTKWNRYPADVLPMWIADMDIAAPPAVLQALHARLDQRVVGRRERQLVDQHALQGIPRHVDTLPEAGRANQHMAHSIRRRTKAFHDLPLGRVARRARHLSVQSRGYPAR